MDQCEDRLATLYWLMFNTGLLLGLAMVLNVGLQGWALLAAGRDRRFVIFRKHPFGVHANCSWTRTSDTERCMAPIHYRSLICFNVLELVCYPHCPVGKDRMELEDTFARLKARREAVRSAAVLRSEPAYEDGCVLLQNCGTASMVTRERRMSKIMFPMMVSTRKKIWKCCSQVIQFSLLVVVVFFIVHNLGLNSVVWAIWTFLYVLDSWLVFRCGNWMHKR